MTTFARGVATWLAIAEETTLGEASAANGQLLRRVSADLNLNIQPIISQEITRSQQIRDHRNGPRQNGGTLQGQLSPGSYKDFFQALLRKDFVAGVSEAGLTDTALVNPGSGANMTLTSTGTNWITSGFKAGDVIRITGAAGGAAVTNNQNLRVISITAGPNTMTLAPDDDVVGWASGETVTVAVAGKKVWIPATGQLYKSYTIERWYSDVAYSEVYLGNRITNMTLNLPASGFVTFQAGVTGLNQLTYGSQQYASAAAESSSVGVTAVDGKLMYKGADIGYVTGMNMQIAPAVQTTPVVGSNILPEVFLGTLVVSGSFSCLFNPGDTLTADFLNEVEVEIMLYLNSNPAANSDFISVYLPRVKLSSLSKNDSDRAIIRNFNFQALEKVAGAGAGTQYDNTTIVVQDSLA